jgi:hypothetical protein
MERLFKVCSWQFCLRCSISNCPKTRINDSQVFSYLSEDELEHKVSLVSRDWKRLALEVETETVNARFQTLALGSPSLSSTASTASTASAARSMTSSAPMPLLGGGFSLSATAPTIAGDAEADVSDDQDRSNADLSRALLPVSATAPPSPSSSPALVARRRRASADASATRSQ